MIVSMKHMTLIALRCDEERIMRALQKLCAVEVIPSDAEKSAVDLNGELFAKYETALKTLSATSDKLKPYSKKIGLLTPLPEVDESALSDINIRTRANDIVERTESISREISELSAYIQQKEQLIGQLLPWETLSAPMENLCPTKHTHILCGFVPQENVAVIADISGVAAEFLHSDADHVPCVICTHKADDAIANRLADEGFIACNLPKLIGTVADNIGRLRVEQADAQAKLDDLYVRLQNLATSRDEVLLAIDAVHVEYDRLRSMADVLKSKSAFLLGAWVRSDDEAKVEKAVQSITDAYFMQIRDPAEGENPPSVVKTNKVARPFESIVNMYSRPAYNGIDATTLVTPFYMLFFGMMLCDVCYGLLLFAGTMLYNHFKKPTGGMNGLLGVLKWCGLSTIVCGLLFGTAFGMDIDSIIGTTDVFPLIMDPMVNVMAMLILSCVMGLVHMMFGLCVKIYMCLRDGDVQSAIYDNLSWIFLIVGILGGALLKSPYNSAFIIMAILGAGLIIIFGGREKKGIMKFLGGFASLYNITGWLSDTVSYARIFAIGLVGGAMGNVFNMIGAMIAGDGGFSILHIVRIVLAGVVLVALHAFSLFINVLSAYAHTARLQYVEFFGKFYEPGGRAFVPLSINTRNVRIKNTD